MEKIDIRDIDFTKLQILNSIRTTESTLYYDDTLFYKFFDNLLVVPRKVKKILLLNEGENIPEVVIPHILLKNKLLTLGCAMDYVKNAHSLVKYKNLELFILLIYAVSRSLKEIHNDPRNIVVGDLHFNNILVDNNFKHHFIDFDSCMIDGISQDRLPNSLMNYIYNRGKFNFKVGKETDKLCMFLSLLSAIFGKELDYLDMNEYDEKAEKITTLKNMRNYVLEIKNNIMNIPDVPYLSDVISISDFPGTNVRKLKK